jgi:hypothetical protein
LDERLLPLLNEPCWVLPEGVQLELLELPELLLLLLPDEVLPLLHEELLPEVEEGVPLWYELRRTPLLVNPEEPEAGLGLFTNPPPEGRLFTGVLLLLQPLLLFQPLFQPLWLFHPLLFQLLPDQPPPQYILVLYIWL